MDRELLMARLNLWAVLQNAEDVVRLDEEAGRLIANWRITVQFTVRNGPAAFLEFENGACRHGKGRAIAPDVHLFFVSPAHLNRMFDGASAPIPLKGFTRLGFLKNGFAKLTDRLEYFLKPSPDRLADAEYARINTVLSLQTAAYAAAELAALDPVGRSVAGHMPDGAVQLEVLPDGPSLYVAFDGESAEAGKGEAPDPLARMAFRDMTVANALVTNQLDPFLAVGRGDLMLRGRLDMVDNLNLILDRVPVYLE